MHRCSPCKSVREQLAKAPCEVVRFDDTDEAGVIDFAAVDYWTPAAIVFLCAILKPLAGAKEKSLFRKSS